MIISLQKNHIHRSERSLQEFRIYKKNLLCKEGKAIRKAEKDEKKKSIHLGWMIPYMAACKPLIVWNKKEK